MDPLWLVRTARWARRPPSRRGLVAGAVASGIVLALVGIEALWGWPEALTPTRARGVPLR